jgi:hypothetical protein
MKALMFLAFTLAFVGCGPANSPVTTNLCSTGYCYNSLYGGCCPHSYPYELSNGLCYDTAAAASADYGTVTCY